MRSGRTWTLVDEAGLALMRACRPLGRAVPFLTAVAMPILVSAPLVACNCKHSCDDRPYRPRETAGDTGDTGDTGGEPCEPDLRR